MLEEVMNRRLRVVERFAWQSDDGSPMNPDVGSVHMWFEGGRGVHFDGLVGSPLTSAARMFDEIAEVVGVTLSFADRTMTLSLREGEIDTSPR